MLKIKPAFLSLLFLLIHGSFIAQTSSHLDYKIKTSGEIRRQSFAMDVLIGGLTGGFGALLHKQPDERGVKIFLKGLGQGIFGGSANFLAKDLTYKINQHNTLEYAWLSKLSSSVGTSVLENAATNRNFWESAHVHFGPLRLQFDSRNSYRLQARLLPMALYGSIGNSVRGQLNLGYTLRTGTPVFFSEKTIPVRGSNRRGVASTNSFVIFEGAKEDYGLIAHELIHTFQYEQDAGLNMILTKPVKNWAAKSATVERSLKWLHPDFNYFTFSTEYTLMNSGDCDLKNWFEQEASGLAHRRNLVICK